MIRETLTELLCPRMWLDALCAVAAAIAVPVIVIAVMVICG